MSVMRNAIIMGQACLDTKEAKLVNWNAIGRALGFEPLVTVVDYNEAVRLLRELEYQFRILCQQLNITLPGNTEYYPGQFWRQPEDLTTDKLAEMVKGLRQNLSDLYNA